MDYAVILAIIESTFIIFALCNNDDIILAIIESTFIIFALCNNDDIIL